MNQHQQSTGPVRGTGREGVWDLGPSTYFSPLLFVRLLVLLFLFLLLVFVFLLLSFLLFSFAFNTPVPNLPNHVNLLPHPTAQLIQFPQDMKHHTFDLPQESEESEESTHRERNEKKHNVHTT